MKSLHAPGNLKIEYVPVGKLKPLAKNARAHPPDQIEAMVKAIQRFGFYAPLLVDQKKGVIVKGNGSFQAACQIGMRTVPVIYTQALTAAELRALVIWDNRSAERSGWDKAILAGELTDLKAMGFDLELTGFSLGEIDDFLKPPPSRDDEPPVPALPKHAVSKLGDVWCLGEHRLACGDATKPDHIKTLMAGERAQCVFTDPPYGISYEAPSGSFEVIKGDDLRRGQLTDLLHRAFAAALPHCKEDAAWYVWHASATRDEFAKALRDVGIVELGTIIWAKPGIVLGWSDYRWAHEPCLYAARQGVKPAWYGDRKQTTVWRVAAASAQGTTHTAIGTGVVLTTKDGDELYVSALVPKGRKVRHVHLEAQALALSSSGGPEDDVWEVGRDNGHGKSTETFHPTQKPVELARRALRNSTAEGEIVLDLFAGSAEHAHRRRAHQAPRLRDRARRALRRRRRAALAGRHRQDRHARGDRQDVRSHAEAAAREEGCVMDLRPGAINLMPRGPYPPDARERWKNLHRARRIFRRDQDRLAAVLGKIPPGPLRDRAIEKLLYPPIIVDPLLPGA